MYQCSASLPLCSNNQLMIGGFASERVYKAENVCITPQNTYDLVCTSLQWRHNELDGVSNHQPHDCLLNCLFRPRSKKTSKLWVTGLCAENSTVTGEFHTQMASNAENVSVWWRHHVIKHTVGTHFQKKVNVVFYNGNSLTHQSTICIEYKARATVFKIVYS